MSNYTPQPGTIPYRAIAHLKTLGEGAELATAVLCEEIGAQPNGFHACMLPAQRQGLVRASKKLRISYWSLGDGQAVVAGPAVDADGEDAAEHQGSNHTAPTHAEMLLSAWGKPATVDAAQPTVDLDPADFGLRPLSWAEIDDLEEGELDEPFACALWSDGRLQLQQVGEEMVLTVEQTRQLVAYLERMGVEA